MLAIDFSGEFYPQEVRNTKKLNFFLQNRIFPPSVNPPPLIVKNLSQSVSLQRIGEIFLVAAPELKLLMKTYCEKHPMVMDIINKKR